MIRKWKLVISAVCTSVWLIGALATSAVWSETELAGSDLKRPYDKDALSHYNKAVQRHQAGYLDQAMAEYEIAIKLDDRMVEAWTNLGGIYVVQKNYEKAVEMFKKALAITPNQPSILNAYGTALLDLGRVDEAIEQFNAALKIQPSDSSASENLSRALKAKRKTN